MVGDASQAERAERILLVPSRESPVMAKQFYFQMLGFELLLACLGLFVSVHSQEAPQVLQPSRFSGNTEALVC